MDLEHSSISKPMIMAFHFLGALSHIQKTTTHSTFVCRCHRIRCAAYTSMALSTGGHSAWSRALLRGKLRRGGLRKRAVILQRPRKRAVRLEEGCQDGADVLRRLVPGSAGMDSAELLDETADYIRCLEEQVSLMRSIVNVVSSL
ncbi:transcription factor IBH1-like [Curcuma longa]|uniref:transcription factor IBH1-like n=1 Tax=Curcuma longa TaxID=136217 RepID=UPI003D9DFE16